ncbi:hypothetical protein BGZ97_004625 [Linnemannia gamsii]|uniref:F-box domain-containing protein n=1 Tax=Linnemannia gamsii TaxID=64522 RepID=A0A9P6UFR8_9FUNG|nr:hypothetical protein BGZ97_004625 [Linnemannia gamsii]
MPLTPDNRPKNPLDLPEIRTRIARFLNRQDCLNCMRVSQDWFQDFTPALWHTVDFATDTTAFERVTPETLDKYGGFIAQTVNISTTGHLKTLQHSKISSLVIIKAQLANCCIFYQLLCDTIRRSQGVLTWVDICAKPPNPDTLAEMWKDGLHYIHVLDAIAAPPPPLTERAEVARTNSLTTLQFDRICITRESFSSLLQRCPSLRLLALCQVIISNHTPSLILFSGSQLRYLVCSIAQVWKLDPNDNSPPCLLAHFPLLKSWSVTSTQRSADITSTLMSQDITRYCPHLKNIRIYHGDSATASDLLAEAFVGLESCTLSHKLFDASTILGLIAHQDSLTSVSITNAGVIIQDESSLKCLYMIPRLCRRLQFLSMESIAYEIERVESRKWVCKDLRELRVRFKGLDTPNEIDGCLKQLCSMRQSGVTSLAQPMAPDAIVTRIAHHLLQFKQLRTVWLGSKDYYLPLSPI